METFPRRGIELTLDCELRFTKPAPVRPAITYNNEDGTDVGRFRGPRGFVKFVVRFVGAGENFGTVTDFIDRHGVVRKFEIVHPQFGTGAAKLLLQEHPMDIVISGNPSWYAFEIPMKAVF